MNVKEMEVFPIPLGPLIRGWARDGSLKNRLRAVLAEAVEAETGARVLVDSLLDREIRLCLDRVFLTAAGMKRGNT